MLSTIKTSFGYLLFIMGIHGGGSIEDIYNYLRISDSLSSSGQPTEEQFYSIRDADFTTVINLLPSNTENALKNEGELVTRLGMNYIHIPVSGKKPTEEDYNKFVNSLQAATSEKVWIHCAANARVSAFLYRYRCTVLGEDQQTVKDDVLKIWKPIGLWRKFISWDGKKLEHAKG
jgi:protein tyrosine phosphatase (PTP) superfamily phosphohydrolase (DUF442 family)